MAKPKAYVTAPFRGDGLDLLNEITDAVIDPWIDHQPLRIMDGKGLAEKIDETGAQILIVESDFVTDPVYDLPLLLIGSCRGDPNNIDVAKATAAGIPVLRAPGRNADAVAEMTMALLFAVNRWVVPADADVRHGEIFKDGLIPYQRFRAWQVAGRTVGIVGLGAVGRAAKWRFEGLGMRVLAFDPFSNDATHDDLDAMLAESDVVSMHAAVTPDTERMIGAEQFGAMKDGAIYLNSARAMLHDTDALVAALRSGKLAGAGLDHFEGENLATDHPLCTMDNVVLTPHIGGATYDTEANHSRMIAEDVRRILNHEPPLNCVNPEVLTHG